MSALQAGQYIEANGLKIHYGEAGDSSRQALILLHGGTATLEMWEDYTPAYAEHFHVIAPDTRGHGKTVNPADELDYHQLGDDLAALIRALKLDKPILFGYSDGGHITMDVGVRYPELVGGLIIGGTLNKFGEPYYQVIKGFGLPSAGEIDTEAMEDEWIDYLKSAHVGDGDPDYWRTFAKQISKLWWMPTEYTEDDLKKISVPTMILVGDRDKGVPVEQAANMYRAITNAELFVIPNTDHGDAGAQLTNPIVIDFLSRHKL